MRQLFNSQPCLDSQNCLDSPQPDWLFSLTRSSRRNSTVEISFLYCDTFISFFCERFLLFLSPIWLDVLTKRQIWSDTLTFLSSYFSFCFSVSFYGAPSLLFPTNLTLIYCVYMNFITISCIQIKGRCRVIFLYFLQNIEFQSPGTGCFWRGVSGLFQEIQRGFYGNARGCENTSRALNQSGWVFS